MGQRAVLGLLFAMSAVWATTPEENSHTKPQADISGSGAQLVGTWRLISRVVTLEDGTAVQDPGLGKTPTGYLIYDSSGHMAVQLMRLDRPTAIDCGTRFPSVRRQTDHYRADEHDERETDQNTHLGASTLICLRNRRVIADGSPKRHPGNSQTRFRAYRRQPGNNDANRVCRDYFRIARHRGKIAKIVRNGSTYNRGDLLE